MAQRIDGNRLSYVEAGATEEREVADGVRVRIELRDPRVQETGERKNGGAERGVRHAREIHHAGAIHGDCRALVVAGAPEERRPREMAGRVESRGERVVAGSDTTSARSEIKGLGRSRHVRVAGAIDGDRTGTVACRPPEVGRVPDRPARVDLRDERVARTGRGRNTRRGDAAVEDRLEHERATGGEIRGGRAA